MSWSMAIAAIIIDDRVWSIANIKNMHKNNYISSQIQQKEWSFGQLEQERALISCTIRPTHTPDVTEPRTTLPVSSLHYLAPRYCGLSLRCVQEYQDFPTAQQIQVCAECQGEKGNHNIHGARGRDGRAIFGVGKGHTGRDTLGQSYQGQLVN